MLETEDLKIPVKYAKKIKTALLLLYVQGAPHTQGTAHKHYLQT